MLQHAKPLLMLYIHPTPSAKYPMRCGGCHGESPLISKDRTSSRTSSKLLGQSFFEGLWERSLIHTLKKRKFWDWNISWKTALFFGICVSLHLLMPSRICTLWLIGHEFCDLRFSTSLLKSVQEHDLIRQVTDEIPLEGALFLHDQAWIWMQAAEIETLRDT